MRSSAATAGDGDDEREGTVQTVVSLSYPVQDGATPFGLPPRMLPMVLDLPKTIKFYPTRADVNDVVTALTTALSTWRNDNKLPPDS